MDKTGITNHITKTTQYSSHSRVNYNIQYMHIQKNQEIFVQVKKHHFKITPKIQVVTSRKNRRTSYQIHL